MELVDMIEVKCVTKKYGKITALKDFSFSLESGDIVGFIGPNGAGKSTMMKIMTGCLAPTEGSVTVNGFDIINDPIKAKKNIGYLPEKPPLYPRFTVSEYLNTIFDIKQLKVNRKERIGEVIELTGLSGVAKRRIGNLSNGYCQRVGLAQAILSYPPFLVLDEPTSGLDPAQKRDMLMLVKKLSKTGGIILSSHILSEIDSVCNKILMINKGSLVSFGDKDELGLKKNDDRQKLALKYVVSGERTAVLGALSGLSGICDIAADEKEGTTECIITVYEDIREKIFMRLSQNKLPILTCFVMSTDLENAFLNMTCDKAKVNKNGRKRGDTA